MYLVGFRLHGAFGLRLGVGSFSKLRVSRNSRKDYISIVALDLVGLEELWASWRLVKAPLDPFWDLGFCASFLTWQIELAVGSAMAKHFNGGLMDPFCGLLESGGFHAGCSLSLDHSSGLMQVKAQSDIGRQLLHEYDGSNFRLARLQNQGRANCFNEPWSHYWVMAPSEQRLLQDNVTLPR